MNSTPNISLRPKVVLFLSDPSLGVYLVENLLSNFCEVFLCVKDSGYWSEKLLHLSENNYLHITENLEAYKNEASYVIVCKDFFTTRSDLKNLLIVNAYINSNSSVLVIIPYAAETTENKEISLEIYKNFSFVQNLKTIFIGDIFGPRMVLGQNAFSEKIKEVLSGKLVVGLQQFYFPTFSPHLAKEIVKTMFSFGEREGIFYYSEKISENELISHFKQYNLSFTVNYTKIKTNREFFNVKKYFVIPTNLKSSYKQTFEWLSSHEPEIVTVKRSFTKAETKKDNQKVAKEYEKLRSWRKPKLNFKILFSLLFVLLTPYFFTFFSVFSFWLSVSRLLISDYKTTKNLMNISQSLNSVSQGIFFAYTKTPLVGNVFVSSYKMSNFISKTFAVGIDASKLYVDLSNALESTLSKKQIPLTSLASETSLLSENLYNDISFLSEESKGLGVYSPLVVRILEKLEINNLRAKLLFGKNFFKYLPLTLGEEKPVTYMILFQNNNEIRPTGGFIGSFALVSFYQGAMQNFDVYDVYDADGQLKGYVAPPRAIKEHLGEAAWYMRDANWDPDFPSSAAKIEWFLEKEMGKSVDGVFSVDLEVAKSLLSGVGPIYLPDFGKTINKDNFYVETQIAAESEFFPGSDKKRNFLTALNRALIQEVTNNGIKNKKELGLNLLNNLDGKHVQLYFNNSTLKKLFSDQNYDGGVNLPICSQNCHNDFVSIVDANLGVNKANYYVSKQIALDLNINESVLEHRLTLNYSNSATVGSGNNYKNYLRLLLPINSEVSYLEVNGIRQGFDTENISGRKEVGFLLNVPESQQAIVNLGWSQKVNKDIVGEYQLLVRKQSGSGSDPILVQYNLPNSQLIGNGVWGPSLTNTGAYSYNTVLRRDLVSRFKLNK